MKALGTTLGASMRLAGETELAARASGTARNKDVQALRQAQRALRSAAIDLAKIRPPADIRRPQALLLQGVKEYAAELDSIIAKLKAGGTPTTVLQKILALKGIKDMQHASIEIEQRGYDIVSG
jgi:hypothetical protein